MQHKTICSIFLSSSLFVCVGLFGQDKSYFKLSGSYLTNSVYNGRKDSTILPYIIPSITYYDKSGFNIGTSIYYLNSANAQRVDLVSIDADYDFKIANQVNGSIYASKYFYNANSTSVRGDSKGALGGSFSYENNIISVSGDASVLFSDKSDFLFTPSVYHTFNFGDKNNAWAIAPTITANIGTLNYYKQYFQNIDKKRRRVLPQLVQFKNADGILLLDYELSLPITYDGKGWGLYITPTYAIPQSPIQVTTPGGNIFRTEKLENSFYAEFGLYVTF